MTQTETWLKAHRPEHQRMSRAYRNKRLSYECFSLMGKALAAFCQLSRESDDKVLDYQYQWLLARRTIAQLKCYKGA